MSTAFAQDGGRVGPRGAAAGSALLVLGLVVPLALLVQGGWSPLLTLDERVGDVAEDLVATVPGLLTAARLVTLLGDPALVTALTAVAAAGLALRGRVRLAAYAVLSRAGAVLLSTSVKQAVGRERPVFDDPVATAGGPAFPSGHALGSAAFWLTAAVVTLPLLPARARRAVLLVALVVPALVAASRVLLGVHHPSDVVAGLALGFGWAVVCAALLGVDRPGEQATEPDDRTPYDRASYDRTPHPEPDR